MGQLIKTKDFKCRYCNSTEYIEKFDMNVLMDIDTLLISSRHLYRAPYSFHEKSGLISVPIDQDKILEFEILEKIRGEKKFDSVKDLIEQINKDCKKIQK